MKEKTRLKDKRVLIFIALFCLFAIVPISRAFIPTLQADPLSQLVCTSIEPMHITIPSHGTGEKPQSKAWPHDGEWWAVFPTDTSGASSAGTWIWKLVEAQGNYSWSEVLKISSRTDSKADVKVDGNVAHILLFANSSPGSTALVSVEYAAGTYSLWTTRPTATGISLDSGSETATIDLDSTGRMWLATKDADEHIVYYSDSPYSSWSNTFAVDSLNNVDDISVVTKLPGNLIGVLWSDQSSEEFKFRVHVDGADPTTWSSVETISSSGPFADDHLNVAVAANGTVYGAVKTGNDTIELIVRRPNGSWDSPYEVDNIGTRPIVQLNEVAGVVDVIYPTATGDGGDIIFKETAVSNISFGGSGSRVTLQSGSLNDPSSMKNSYDDDLVIIFNNRSTEKIHGEYCRSGAAAPKADLGVTKVDAADPITVGENVTYTVTVDNSGPDTAENVVVIDTLPASVNYVSATPDQGSCSEGSGIVTCELDAINNSNAVNITIVASTTIPGKITNNVTVSSGTDDNNGGNDSASEETLVTDPNKENTTTALTSSQNPSVYGQAVTFTATVTPATTPGPATGSVTFKEGTTVLGTGSLDGTGKATFSSSALSVATHPITAEYSGDSTYNASSDSLDQVVNKADTTTGVTSSANPSVVGQPVTFTANVTAVAPGSGTPTGTITFKEGTTVLGTDSLDDAGQATLTSSTLTAGTQSITAEYSSDSNFNASNNSLDQVVDKADTTTGVSSSANPSAVGQPVTFTATVAAVAPGSGTLTGTVTFKDGVTVLDTVTVNSAGEATYSSSTLTIGTHTITAEYSGDSNYNASSGAVVPDQVINEKYTIFLPVVLKP